MTDTSSYPSAPTSLASSKISNTAYALSWVAPTWTGGENILIEHYLTYLGIEGDELVLQNTLAPGVTNTTASSLIPGKVYIFGVRATNANGNGSLAIIKLYVPKAPSTITTLAVTLNGGIPILSWTEPDIIGWENVSQYKILMSQVGSPYDWDVMAVLDASILEATHIMATPGKTYYYALTSTGSGGIESEISNVVSIAPTNDIKTITIDNLIRNGSFDLSNINNWVAPQGKSGVSFVDTLPGFYYEKALILNKSKIYQDITVTTGHTVILIASGLASSNRDDRIILSTGTDVLETISLVGYTPQRYYTTHNVLDGEEDLRVYLVGTETFTGL